MEETSSRGCGGAVAGTGDRLPPQPSMAISGADEGRGFSWTLSRCSSIDGFSFDAFTGAVGPRSGIGIIVPGIGTIRSVLGALDAVFGGLIGVEITSIR